MKTYIHTFIFCLFLSFFGSAQAASIHTSNRILAKVAEESITVLDVKREMDRQIYMNDKKMFGDTQAVYAHYMQNWKSVLQKMIQDEMLFLKSKKLGYKLPSHEITKKVTEMYGSDVVTTCRDLSITAEKARKHANKEIISSHLSWYGIWSKSMMKATPKVVTKAYEDHIVNLEKQDKWTYQAIYVKGKDEKDVHGASEEISQMLKEAGSENIAAFLTGIGAKHENLNLRASKDITLQKGDLSPALFSTLSALEEGMSSEVINAKKGEQFIGKILCLKKVEKERIPPYTEIAEVLKNGLVNSLGAKNSKKFFDDLYKEYDVDGLYGNALATSTIQPFALQDD